MSLQYPNVNDYWRELAPRLKAFVEHRRDHAVEAFLEKAFAVYSYVCEDMTQKRNAHVALAGHLDPLVVLGLDYLRGARALQESQSLAPAAFTARAAFEAFVTLKFITTSTTPDLYAKRFTDHQMVERLKRHYLGRTLLHPSELASLTTACAAWLDPKTGRPHRRRKWHGEEWSFREVAQRTGELAMYDRLYSVNSLFAHGSSIVKNLYRQGASLNGLADTKQLTRQSILTAGSCLNLIAAHSTFFGIPMPVPEYATVVAEMVALAALT